MKAKSKYYHKCQHLNDFVIKGQNNEILNDKFNSFRNFGPRLKGVMAVETY